MVNFFFLFLPSIFSFLYLNAKLSIPPQKNNVPFLLLKERTIRKRTYFNVLTKLKNHALKSMYRTKLFVYLNDINNLNLNDGKNEFYLIALPLSEKFNPFPGMFCHNHIQYSDKVSLPIFIYDLLINKHIEVPWNFAIEKVEIKKNPIFPNVSIINKEAVQKYSNINKLNRVFINVLDFKAKKNFIFLPEWVMQTLDLNSFDVIRLRIVKLEMARNVILQPHQKSFFDLLEPKKILEENLRYYSCLTKNSTICINHENSNYYFDVLQIDSERKKNVEVASIQDADVIFDFVKEKYN